MISCGIKELDDLMMTKCGARPLLCEKIVRVGSITIAKLPGNRWWSSWESFNKIHQSPKTYDWRVEALLKGLALLGIISATSLQEYRQLVGKATSDRDRKDDQESIDRIGKRHGVKMPKLPKFKEAKDGRSPAKAISP